MTPFIEKYIDTVVKNLNLSGANEKELRTDIGNIIGEAYNAGRKDEREACYKIANDTAEEASHANRSGNTEAYINDGWYAATHIAGTIRLRSEAL